MQFQRLMKTRPTFRGGLSALRRQLQTSRLPASLQLSADIVDQMNNDRQAFLDTWPTFLKGVTETNARTSDLKSVLGYLHNMLDYAITKGSLYSGLITVGVAKFSRPDPAIKNTDEDVFLAHMLGWCTEMLYAVYIIVDDLTDNANVRYGDQPWFRKPGVGLNVANDAFIIHYTMNRMIHKYFGHKPCYLDILETFKQVGFRFYSGQSLENNVRTFDAAAKLTMETFLSIARFKSAGLVQSFIDVGLSKNGISDPEIRDNCVQLSNRLGLLLQIANDVKDSLEETGTDIEDGKSTWLAAKALQLADPRQAAVIQENYGKADRESKHRVMDVLKELDIRTHAESEMANIADQVRTLLPTWKLPLNCSLNVTNRLLTLLNVYYTRGM